MTTVASGRWISAPAVVEMRHRQKAEAGDQRGHQHGPEADEGGFVGRDPGRHAVDAQVLGAADPDQAVEHRHAEQGDEADAGRDAERHARAGPGRRRRRRPPSARPGRSAAASRIDLKVVYSSNQISSSTIGVISDSRRLADCRFSKSPPHWSE